MKSELIKIENPGRGTALSCVLHLLLDHISLHMLSSRTILYPDFFIEIFSYKIY